MKTSGEAMRLYLGWEKTQVVIFRSIISIVSPRLCGVTVIRFISVPG